jgi:phospholipid transport system substrate-binding protein
MTTSLLIKPLQAVLFALLFVAGTLSASQPEGARQLVEETSHKMLSILQEKQALIVEHPEEIYRLVDELVLPHFDFERMVRWTMARNWRDASASQRERLVEEFRSMLVRTYSTALNEYANAKIRYLPLRSRSGDTEVTVRTEAEVAGGLPVPVDYSLYLNDNGAWKVFDVAIDGLSLITNYRSSFASEVRASGIDGLIEKLSARNRQAEK